MADFADRSLGIAGIVSERDLMRAIGQGEPTMV
jgi:hypothetical protein